MTLVSKSGNFSNIEDLAKKFGDFKLHVVDSSFTGIKDNKTASKVTNIFFNNNTMNNYEFTNA